MPTVYKLVTAYLLTTATLLVSAVPAQAEKILRWKFVAGQKLSVQMEQQIQTETTYSNKPVKMTIDVLMKMNWDVAAVQESGTARVVQSFEQIVLKMNVPPGTVAEFDSANPKKPTGDAKDLAALVTPMLGAKLHTQFGARGEIIEVQVAEETVTALAAASGGQALFTKDRISQLLRQSAAVMPDKAIKIGDHWNETTTLESPLGKLLQTTTYTYAGEETRGELVLDKLQVDAKLQIPAAEPEAKTPVLKEQTLTGTIWFDNTAGRLVESQLTQRMKTETKVRENVVSATAMSTLKTTIVERK